jgi:hypothetical protein
MRATIEGFSGPGRTKTGEPVSDAAFGRRFAFLRG